MKLDPNLKKYLSSNAQDPLLVFIKVDAKKFEYSRLPPSNEKDNPRLTAFKKEMQEFSAQFQYCQPQEYLSNMSLFEAMVDRKTLHQLIDFHAVTGLQAIGKLE